MHHITEFLNRQETIETIRRLYKTQGKTIAQIAKIVGVSYTALRNAMLRHGIITRPAGRLYSINENVFDKVDDEPTAYWLGFLYADGCVHRTCLSIALKQADSKHLALLASFLGANSPIVPYQTRSALAVSGRHLSARLKELGIVKGRPTHIETVNQIGVSVVRHFVRGLFDGDGGVEKEPSHKVTFCGRTELMAWLRALFAQECGTSALLKPIQCNHSYIAYLGYKGYFNATKITDYMYEGATIFLERKQRRIRQWIMPNKKKSAKKGWKTRRENGSRLNQYK